ncbi:OLC1v1012109C1 [Oldenlandia corymbosa var. corymbosa]|uniref:Exocyst subunit Exo70 family protein n=1 Tax=Oldenlandia corymbosa var. corymbosa TaxID=529605 RepID=A0AAV1DY86_OLDCO|nr:OLC1v1012109C1 [Oldenlandia corymbosa var. corymbosa]
MENSESVIDSQQHLLAAVYHLVKALNGSNDLVNGDMKRVLSELDVQLSRLSLVDDTSEADRTKEIENRLKFAQKKIMSFESKGSKVWDSGPGEDYGYLQAVDEVRRLANSLENMPTSQTLKGKQLRDEAQNILQAAMAKLQEELVQILSKNMKQLAAHESVCLPILCEETAVGDEEESSIVSAEDISFEVPGQRSRAINEYEQHLVDLVHPNAITLIKAIAEVMFASDYGQEFRHAFIGFWRKALDDYLITLNVKQVSIEDVLKMDWKCLNCRIKNWCRATRSLIGFYLPSKRRLFNQILEGLGSMSSSCFIEASKASVMCFLNFGQAVIIGPKTPERLFCLLDMYEVMSGHLQDLNYLFADDDGSGLGSFVRNEFHELLEKLGNSAKEIFLQLGNHIASNTSRTAFTSGGITHLTRYVMNYMMLVQDYGHTLNLLLEEQNLIDNPGRVSNAEVSQIIDGYRTSPVAHFLQSVTSILEANLDAKSDLYRDEALKHIFMMNNIHYMVQKIENSEIRSYFGDEWLRRHVRKFRQHATTYERIAWGNILSMLKDDGCKGKAALKVKCQKFNAAFEELYKSQTGWNIPDRELREDVRISASGKLINAYRPFAGRLRDGCISDRYIKYTADDLGNYIWDLFEASPKSLNHHIRR